MPHSFFQGLLPFVRQRLQSDGGKCLKSAVSTKECVTADSDRQVLSSVHVSENAVRSVVLGLSDGAASQISLLNIPGCTCLPEAVHLMHLSLPSFKPYFLVGVSWQFPFR